jgi:hypothetical protein
MAKLIVSRDDQTLCVIALDREVMRIGRSRESDIHLDDLAVSASHARITTILGDSFLEDLDSTTGTTVNDVPVKKHVLQHADVIAAGSYRLRYDAKSARAPAGAGADMDVAVPERADRAAALRLLTGPQAGAVVQLAKAVTRFGEPGLQVAAVVRDGECYVLRHVEGERYPALNGTPLVPPGQTLEEGDIVDLGGHRLQFTRTPS